MGKNHTKWEPDETMMEYAFFNPNFYNPESNFVSGEGQKRVYPYEGDDVKANLNIVQACHTDIGAIIN